MRNHPVLRMLVMLAVVVAIAVGNSSLAGEALEYPQTRRGDQTDDYHGTIVADPYRWLENDVREDSEVRNWVTAENEVTFGYLHSIAARKPILDRLTKLWNYERTSTPVKKAGRYFYTHNDGLQDQSVLYYRELLNGKEKVLIDPNTWSEDGTVALRERSYSPDGRYMAYAIADGGSDWRKWKVRDLDTNEDLPDELRWVKFSGTTWTGDGDGFFYCRFDAPAEDAAYQQSNLNMRIFYHRVGTSQPEDRLVYERPDKPEWGFSCSDITPGSPYMAITVWKTGDKVLLYYLDITKPDAEPVELIGGWDSEYSFLGNDGPIFYIQTELDAPNKRVVAVDIRKPDRSNWKTIIPESEDALRGASLVGDYLIANYMHDAASRVRICTLEGKHVRDVELPGLGTARGFGGERGDNETFYSFSSFATPTTIYRYDVATGESAEFWHANVDIDIDQFAVEQVFYISKDGTRVPMFITRKKDAVMDGSNPTLLYGYGGFNASMTPYFSATNLAWVEMGGIYAVACIRGGSEYGEKWHEAGTKTHKQNVFDDFVAAAEWLIGNQYTSSEKLAIRGASNGGLLVGAVMTQRPELFAACIPQVGVMDMLRFNKFTAGRYWTADYGSADNPDEFEALFAYSPYHNLKPGTAYPATLVTTADTDDRVVPGHSFKFAAALQAAHTGEAPVVIRIETRAGHGAGTPTSKQIEQYSDMFAFLVDNLHMTLPAGY